MNEDRFLFRGMNKGAWYIGGYFKHLPYTPYCCGPKPRDEDYKHLIIRDGFSDWGLPRDMTCIEIDSKTLGQCTGMKDKNGKLIFEGDIVRKLDCNALGYPRERICQVLWGADYYVWELLTTLGDGYSLSDFNSEQLEIIGNIHENADLLKGDDEDDE